MNMNAQRYRVLGYLVWRGGRWYLRRAYLRRLPSRRTVVAAGGGALALTAALAALVTRARG
jgi:hypothetical protein